MGERSSSGVRGIRAMFEAKGETTSPPSRGRSPIDSEGVRSTSSRPLSKVRTSFVTVERSGLLGPVIGLRKMSDTGDAVPQMGNGVVGDTKDSTISQLAAGHQVEVGGEHTHDSKANGIQTLGSSENVKHGDMEGILNFDGPSSSLGHEDAIDLETLAPKDTSSGINSTVDLTSVVPQDISENSTTAPLNTSEDLGYVLKGSSFEPEDSTARQTTALPESSAAEISQEVKQEESITQGTEKIKSLSNGKVPSNSKSVASSKVQPSRPSAISTKGTTPHGPKSSHAQPSGNAMKSANPSTPKTPITPSQHDSSKTSSPRQPLEKTSSPRQALPGRSTGRVSSGISSKPPVASANKTPPEADHLNWKTKYPSKPPNSSLVASKRVTSNASSKQPRTSISAPAASEAKIPTTAHTSLPKKPTPKSPTRPVRLPAAATAPTAASAAKLGTSLSAHPSNATSTISTNPNRKSSTLKKDRPTGRTVPAAGAAPGMQKASRPSLPAGSHPADRPKSRASTVGSKPPDEGFLARMMRPTASSASKAHEKIEPKSPPRKAPITKPKRKSEVSEEGKSRLSEDEPKAKAQDDTSTHEPVGDETGVENGVKTDTGLAAEPVST
ncbi:hypothetical protein MMC11_003729 [Xylographa trunciseda]|nr:hypothetical protein [Xylographa trunciseda]